MAVVPQSLPSQPFRSRAPLIERGHIPTGTYYCSRNTACLRAAPAPCSQTPALPPAERVAAAGCRRACAMQMVGYCRACAVESRDRI
eukprot:7021733-Pyramimonas_sp.AAC.1